MLTLALELALAILDFGILDYANIILAKSNVHLMSREMGISVRFGGFGTIDSSAILRISKV